MNNLYCWHDHEYKSLSEVRISPLDFGFIHSDATYDVLRIKNKKILFLDLYTKRFKNSCDYFYFDCIQNIENITQELLLKNNLNDAFLWLICWRGTPQSGSPRDTNVAQHQLVYIKPYYGISSIGVNLCIYKENRRTSNAIVDQKYKNFSWIEFNRAQRKAVEQNYDSALLLTVDGYISEGPGFGICFIKNNKVFSPAKDCLDSMTISIVQKLCSKLNIVFEKKNISEEEALTSDEAFICSTSGGITLVNKLNDKLYTHELSIKLQKEYDSII